MKQKFYLLLLLSLISGSVFSQTIPFYIPTNGLIAFWPFNGNANDESGNGNHGTVNGATLTSDRNGVAGNAYSFDGVSNFISTKDIDLYDTATISVWVYPLTNSGSTGFSEAIIDKSNDQYSNSGYSFLFNNTNTFGLYANIGWSGNTNNVIPSYTNLILNKWHHCLITLNNGTAKIFLDGNIIKTQININSTSVNNENLLFGKSVWGANFFNGIIDDIAIYNRALTQAEITALYNGPTYTINASSGSNGSITPSGITTLNSTATQRYTFTANSGYMLDSVIVDGNKVDSVSGYTFSVLTSNHTIRITYKALNIPSYVPTNGLVGWWPFNGNANDESGNGNHGTVNGATLTSDRNGFAGKAYSFDGNDFIQITNSNTLKTPNNITINCWVLFNGPGSQSPRLVSKGWVPNGIEVHTETNLNHKIRFGGTYSGNGYGPISNTKLNNASWYMVSAIDNGTIKEIYINGIKEDSLTHYLGIVPDNLIDLFFGKNSQNNSDYLDGSLDDIAIYNRALNQQEITALYTGVVSKDIVASSGVNGSISPSGTTAVNAGSSQTYSFNPNSGYWIDSVIVNGVQVPTASSYTFNNVSSNQSIRVTYRSMAAALAAANICANDTLVSTVNLPAQSNVRATTYYSNIYLFNQNNTSNAYKYIVNDRKYTAISDKPTACIECGVAEANGKVYCFNTNGTTQAYDIASNTWQNQANQTNTSTSSIYAASINNKIYVLGTNNNQNTFIQYNPQTNSYTALTNPLINATQSRLVAFNNKLYKIGGTDNNNQPISSVEVYNPSNNTWTSMPDLPVALTQVGATHYDNKLYVFGGKQANNTNSNKVYVFDFTSNAWYAESNTQNTNRTNIEAKTANNMVFLFGGTDSSNTTTNLAQRYFCKDQLCTCKWAEFVCAGISLDIPCNALTPTIQTLRQDTMANTGALYNGTAANNVTATLNYTGANGAAYNARTINSSGVTGLTATLAMGTLNNGNGTLLLTISGTPNTIGIANFSIIIGGQTCVFTRTVKAMLYKAGTVFCNGTPTEVVEVTNPITGRTWMDRNLGASRVAISSDDSLAYGDLYQWGRGADGHQCRNSATTSILSTTDKPNHGNFITIYTNNMSVLHDWRSTQNNNLWQGVNGINNPCPNGFRIPTSNEFTIEYQSWSLKNSQGSFNSTLKITNSGVKSVNDAKIYLVGSQSYYWSSSVSGTNSKYLYLYNNQDPLFIDSDVRGDGMSIRCIKDYPASVGSIDTIGSSNQGILYSGQASNNVSTTINYKNGNGAFCDTLTFQSSGVTGLTAKLSAGYLNNGDGTLTFSISGIPNTSGTAIFNISIGGKNCVFTREIKPMLYKTGTVFCKNIPTEVVEVTNPITGRTWMDRNLGASKVATVNNNTDTLSLGDLYQWGRGADGHQCRINYNTTNTLSTTDVPNNSKIIVPINYPSDWRSPQNNNLWQGVNGINNPCPIGYRLPSQNEFQSEINSWSSSIYTPFTSKLKLPLAGYILYSGGTTSIDPGGGSGYYWTSTISGFGANIFYFNYSNNTAYIGNGQYRSSLYSVRCIKD